MRSTETIHDRRAEDLPINSIVATVTVRDPYSETGEQIKVLRSLRDDPLAGMIARRQIDEAQFQAGRLWQKYAEDSEIGSIRAIDPAKEAATAAGIPAFGTDIVDRGFADLRSTGDFFAQKTRVANIVSNPPFDVFEQYALHALSLTSRKVALIWLVRTLPAAGKWLKYTPLAAVHYLTPRPSMPPGYVIARGEKPGGGTQDFCWLVWDHAHEGPPSLRWLRRDK